MTPYQWACGDSGKEELFLLPFHRNQTQGGAPMHRDWVGGGKRAERDWTKCKL